MKSTGSEAKPVVLGAVKELYQFAMALLGREPLARAAVERACVEACRPNQPGCPRLWAFRLLLEEVRRRRGWWFQLLPTRGGDESGIIGAVRRLPAGQAEAVLLIDVLDFSLADAASIARIEPGELRLRLAAARERLRAGEQRLPGCQEYA